MKRIHGDIKIARRTEVTPEKDYAKYRESLSEDFQTICGYCGKSMEVARTGFEIDHFVPVSIDKSRETDYTNLVFSCFACNRKKGKKWPTGNKDACHNGELGFVDPATEEYDQHLGRNGNGGIIHLTNVGKYMCDTFKFQLRPTSIVWKSMELLKRKQQIYYIRERANLSFENLLLFIEIQSEIDNLLKYLLSKGE